MTAESYGKNDFLISPNDAKLLHFVDDSKFYKTIVYAWASIFLVIFLAKLSIYETNYGFLVYPIFAFLIAGRMGVLLQLVHEAAHGLLVRNKKLNDLYSDLFCAMPLGITNSGYARGHAFHHAYTGTSQDPASDREKYREPNFSKSSVYWLLLKDLFGVTALGVFFSYQKNGIIENKKSNNVSKPIYSNLGMLCKFAIVQITVLSFFHFNILNYFLFWIYPAIGPHMFLMRFRGIAEHGLAGQINADVKHVREGIFYTRSFGTSKKHYNSAIFTYIERLLIGSLNVYYHHEHHLYPSVPFYNLPKLHHLIKEKVQKLNPQVYARGYFSAALRNLTNYQ